MKIFILILLTVSLTACAVVPLAPPPFYDGFYDGPGIGGPRGYFYDGPGMGGPRGHFAPIPPPFGHGSPGRHHR
jgi:hypothetical protein